MAVALSGGRGELTLRDAAANPNRSDEPLIYRGSSIARARSKSNFHKRKSERLLNSIAIVRVK